MSRLDAVTLFVIAACLLAIAFLIYRATDMFGGEDDLDPVDQLREDLAEDEDAVYVPDAEADAAAERRAAEERARIIAERRARAEAEAERSERNAGNPRGDNRIADQGPAGGNRVSTGSDTRAAGNAVRIPSTFDRRPGDYLVLGGTFAYRANAEARAKNLRLAGYDNATMTIFNNGKYAVVLVDRFADYNEAQTLKRKMEREGLETAVLRQRDGGRN